jgi:hypothetical protein
MTLPVKARDVLVVVSIDDTATTELCQALSHLSQGHFVAPWDYPIDGDSRLPPIDAYLERGSVPASQLRRAPHAVLDGVLHDLIGDEVREGELVFLKLPWRAAFDFGLHPETGAPLILDFFSLREVSVVHLVRRDPLQLAIEQLQAKAKFMRLGATKIRLEPDVVGRAARDLQAQQNMLSRFVSQLDARCLRVLSEELSGGYASVNLRRIFRMMGSYVTVPDQMAMPRQEAVATSAVVNLEEILDEVMRNDPDLIAGLPARG